MNTIEFLRHVLPYEGVYVLFRNNLAQGRHRQVYFHSIDELAEAADYYDSDGWDIYFALSNYTTVGTRKGEDAKQIKAFFLDLDCGPEKEFPSQTEALAQLRAFCTALDLPKPLMVNSGRGVHVYWVLSEPVAVEQWKPVAEQFKRKCSEHNFDIDTSVPADTARVLRVVGTHNHKPETPAPVQLINSKPDVVNFDYFASKLGMDTIPVPQKRTGEDGPASLRDALMRNIKYSFKDILIKTQTGEGCEQLARIVKGQAEASEPMWRAGLSIAKFCEDGEKAAQKISEKHPEYTPELTLKKLDLIKGPYRCTTFDESESGICTDCPHWGKVKSPITLGRKIAEAELSEDGTYSEDFGLEGIDIRADDDEGISSQHVIPAYPRPYFRGMNGGVYVRSTSVDGEVDERVIYHNDLYVTRRLLDKEDGESIVAKLHLPKDGVREFTMPLTAVTSRDEFRKQMAMQGVAVTRMDDLMQYMTTWVNELQASATADTAHRQFGWTDDDCKAFVVGSKEIRATGITHNPPTTPTAAIMHYFKPKGTLEGWKDMANFYTTKEGLEMHQYVVCTAFGSPLMQFLPQNCSTLHLHDKAGGAGKTAAMKVGASVWGHFKALMLDDQDTTAMKMNRGEVLHNLPFYIDELTNTPEKEMSDIAYQLSGGQQRGRMSSGSNIERERGSPWKLLAVTTGNMSAIEKISLFKAMPKAEAQRIMEIRAQQILTETKQKEGADHFEEQLDNHYGHAGVVYIQYVMQNLAKVKKLVRDTQLEIDKAAGLTPENRFWSAGAACTMSGAIIAKELGLVDYDVPKLTDWVIQLLKTNLKSVSDMGVSVEQTLNDYMNDNFSNILMIKSTDDLRKQSSNGLDSIVIPDALPRGKLIARYETDLKRAYLVPAPLKAWCGRQQINYSSFVDDLVNKLGAKRTKIRLGKGTNYKLPPSSVIAVPCNTFDESPADTKEEDNLYDNVSTSNKGTGEDAE